MARNNGFSWPLHPTQILSWAEFALAQAITVLIFDKSVYVVLSAVMLTLNLLSSFLVLIWAIALTKSNPCYNGLTLDTTMDKMKLTKCDICQQKNPLDVSHCAACNRCVLGYDHHCTWVNNCIARHNYKRFFILINLFSL